MAETSARVAWASVGLMLPWRLLGAGPLRWATRRILDDQSFSEQTAVLAAWAQTNDGSELGAELIENLA
jgi:UDP:flavonoid glycosyltransferase YjiC (YdhE family)